MSRGGEIDSNRTFLARHISAVRCSPKQQPLRLTCSRDIPTKDALFPAEFFNIIFCIFLQTTQSPRPSPLSPPNYHFSSMSPLSYREWSFFYGAVKSAYMCRDVWWPFTDTKSPTQEERWTTSLIYHVTGWRQEAVVRRTGATVRVLFLNRTLFSLYPLVAVTAAAGRRDRTALGVWCLSVC